MVGSGLPQALAVMMPARAFRIIPSVLSVLEVPVVLAMNISRPSPGVTALPTVDTPIGNG